MKISASFLSMEDENNIEKLDKTSIDYLHLDIMDGKFVSNETWSFSKIKKLLKNTTKPYDVHLMVSDVKKYVKAFSKLKPEYITFHLEAAENRFEVIKTIKSKHIKVGISIKPNTPVMALNDYLPYVDLVLVMSVEPGMGGQKFIDNSINKINELKELRDSENYNYVIEVDGGINDETVNLVSNADIAVVGSFITKSDNYQIQIDKLK